MAIFPINARRAAQFFGAVAGTALLVVIGCMTCAISEGRMHLSSQETLWIVMSMGFIVAFASLVLCIFFASLIRRRTEMQRD